MATSELNNNNIMMNIMKNYVINVIKQHWLFISIIVLLNITALSLIPLEELPATPGSDKTRHLIAYAVLAYPASLRKPAGWKYIIFIFAVYSGLIEICQPYIKRYGEWLDFGANMCGLLLGYSLARLTNSGHQNKLRD